MTTKHPNAHILQRLAEIAQTESEIWRYFEYKDRDGAWRQCGSEFAFVANYGPPVRERILNPIEINGKIFEGLLREAPKANTDYWLLLDDYPSIPHQWNAMPIERGWLCKGRIFRTREARDTVQRELTKLLTGGSNETF